MYGILYPSYYCTVYCTSAKYVLYLCFALWYMRPCWSMLAGLFSTPSFTTVHFDCSSDLLGPTLRAMNTSEFATIRIFGIKNLQPRNNVKYARPAQAAVRGIRTVQWYRTWLAFRAKNVSRGCNKDKKKGKEEEEEEEAVTVPYTIPLYDGVLFFMCGQCQLIFRFISSYILRAIAEGGEKGDLGDIPYYRENKSMQKLPPS